MENARANMRLDWTSAFCAVLFAAAAPAIAADPVLPPRVAIGIERGDWGTARVEDIERVLASVADVLAPHFPQRASTRIVVEHSREGPRALLRRSSDGAYRVLLNVQDTRWDQFAYQFSHELCHVLTNFEHREVSPEAAIRDHQWFEESLCEAVSLYTLKQLTASWERSPPHPGWEDYAPAFGDYATRILSATHWRLPLDLSIAHWYRTQHAQLHANPYLREKNEIFATRLLPLLESMPGSLEAIGYLNLEGSASATSLRSYLQSWYDCCPERYRGFISEVIALFEEGGASANIAAAH